MFAASSNNVKGKKAFMGLKSVSFAQFALLFIMKFDADVVAKEQNAAVERASRLPRAVLSRGSRDCRMQSTSKFAVLRASRNGKTALHGSNGSRPGPRRELTNSSYSLNTPSSSASSTGVSALAVLVDSAGEFGPDGLSLLDSEVGFRCSSPEFSPLVVLICA
jgi:hypothetical protein